MKRNIFLLFEGIPSTIIESQVIENIVILKKEKIDFELWAFCLSNSVYELSKKKKIEIEKKYPNLEIKLFKGINAGLPLSVYLNAFLFISKLKENSIEPNIIHARTDYSAAVANYIKKWNVNSKVVWDARGDTISEYNAYHEQLKPVRKLFSYLTIKRIKNNIKHSSKTSDGVLFVSDALKKHQGKEVITDKVGVFPCVTNSHLFYFDKVIRTNMRKELGILDSEIVLIYVGSMASWQCIDKTVDLINEKLKSDIRYKAIILSPESEKFKSLINADSLERCIICSVDFMDVNKYLNAADIGILIRDENLINKVASPVKFAEYAITGLKIISTKAVDQIVEFNKSLDNVYYLDDLMSLNESVVSSSDERFLLSEKAKSYVDREYYTHNLVEFYNDL